MPLKKEVDLLRKEYIEYLDNIKTLCEKFDISAPSYGIGTDHVLSKGLKVRHSKTGLLYTIRDIDEHFITLEAPEADFTNQQGKLFNVPRDEFVKDYEAD